MKKTLLLALVVFTLASCKKDNIEASIYGKWQYKSASGNYQIPGYVGPLKNEVYQFNTNGTYVKHLDNNITNQGNFNIKISGKTGDYNSGSITLTNPDFRDAFQFKPGTILIGTSIADGLVYEYTKIN